MPSNEDFDYEGLSVENAGGWDANSYHNRTQSPAKKEKSRVQPEPLGPMKGVHSRPNPNNGKQTTLYDHQLEKAAQQDWRNRGLTNNEIIDY